MASVLYLVNNTAQDVIADGLVSPGFVRHRNCQSQATLEGNAIRIVGSGYFSIIVSATVSAPAAGNIEIGLYQDGSQIQGAVASETITTANTQVRNLTIVAEILKKCDGITTLTLVNTGAEATFQNLAIRVKRDA